MSWHDTKKIHGKVAVNLHTVLDTRQGYNYGLTLFRFLIKLRIVNMITVFPRTFNPIEFSKGRRFEWGL
jgi:hypothetical protein